MYVTIEEKIILSVVVKIREKTNHLSERMAISDGWVVSHPNFVVQLAHAQMCNDDNNVTKSFLVFFTSEITNKQGVVT